VIRKRLFPESNYRSIFFDYKTLRFQIDRFKPMTELKYPEFYDVKITSKCNSLCPDCYQDSTPDKDNFPNLIDNFVSYFGKMDENQKPYQIAIGGGEPTLHPDFYKLLVVSRMELGIVPNYTTNGMFMDTKLRNDISLWTQLFCGGVAVSAHEHLESYWRGAVDLFTKAAVKTNIHIIISDKESVDRFLKIFEEYEKEVNYFVLLSYQAMGRAKSKKVESDYLFEKLRGLKDISKVSYGSNFYEDLKKQHWLDVSLYEPEIFSKYLDMETMKLYKSSFNLQEVQ
jgi:organic radical activating enzyme